MADLKESIALCCKQLKISANFAERAMSQKGETNQEYLYNLLSSSEPTRSFSLPEYRLSPFLDWNSTARAKTSSFTAAPEPERLCFPRW